MKIALLGYGKMGKVIEKIAIQRGHQIVLKVDKDSKTYDINDADIAIDFSIPSVAFNNISNCIENNVPVVSGTTGWLDRYEEAISLCRVKNGAFIYASNFSLGVNIFFELNRKLSEIMGQLNDYHISIEEIHHTQKLDAPSGTAISLAEDILKNTSLNNWVLMEGNKNSKEQSSLPITAKRIEGIPGTHTVDYNSEVDSIEIKHTAHNRNGFALGAVIAAEWLVNKSGVYTMRDVLNIN